MHVDYSRVRQSERVLREIFTLPDLNIGEDFTKTLFQWLLLSVVLLSVFFASRCENLIQYLVIFSGLNVLLKHWLLSTTKDKQDGPLVSTVICPGQLLCIFFFMLSSFDWECIFPLTEIETKSNFIVEE